MRNRFCSYWFRSGSGDMNRKCVSQWFRLAIKHGLQTVSVLVSGSDEQLSIVYKPLVCKSGGQTSN